MTFEKLKKEDWLKLSSKEQEFLTLQFQEDREKSRKLIVLITRFIAILCCIGLFYIGYAQVKVVTSDTKIRTQYGSLGYCYLCGLETLRTCTCLYISSNEQIDIKNLSQSIANGNIQPCDKPKEDVSAIKNKAEINWSKIQIIK